MHFDEKIPSQFIQYAADILGDTSAGLSGSEIVKACVGYLTGFKQRAESPDTIEYKIGEIFGEIKSKFQSGYSLRDALEYMDELLFRSQDQKHELSALYEEKIKNMGNAGRNGGEYYTPRPLIRAMIQVIKPQIGERIYDGACGSAGFLYESHDYMRRDDLSANELETLQAGTFYGKEKKSLPSPNNNASSPSWMKRLRGLMRRLPTPNRTWPTLGSCLKAISMTSLPREVTGGWNGGSGMFLTSLQANAS